MANDKNKFAEKLEDTTNLVRAVETGQAERRIKDLEDSIKRIEQSQLERHTKTITIIFSSMTVFVGCFSLLMAGLGIWSKYETHEATKEMRADAKDQMAEFEKQFDRLAGDALKKPKVEILHDQKTLDGQIIEATIGLDGLLPIFPIFLKNIGDKRTDKVTIRLFVSQGANVQSEGQWEGVNTYDKDFSECFLLSTARGDIFINPQEPFDVPGYYLKIYQRNTNVLTFKLEAFYGAEKPAEAQFTLKIK
jgi:hypothetical protein